MAISKVLYGSKILIDLTSDTVTADKLSDDVTAHGKDGEPIVGTLPLNSLISIAQSVTNDSAADITSQIYALIYGFSEDTYNNMVFLEDVDVYIGDYLNTTDTVVTTGVIKDYVRAIES